MRNHQRTQRRGGGGGTAALGGDGSDLISSLPDSIKLEILSFLPIKDVFQTDILSKRWRGLWHFIRKLDFSLLPSTPQYLQDLNRSLTLLKTPKIESFQLCSVISAPYDCHFHEWIMFALKRGVKEVNLHFSRQQEGIKTYILPREILECRSLTSLMLCGCKIEFLMRHSANLPSVKTLRLMYCEIGSIGLIGSIDHLIAGCPTLENLEILGCYVLAFIHISSIRNPRLKYLKINQINLLELDIDAPNLVSLDISGEFFERVSLTNVASLAQVGLGLEFGWTWYNADKCCEILWKPLEAIGHVKDLTLSNTCVQVLALQALKGLPAPTYNGKSLTMMTALYEWELRGIANMLGSSTNIETLNILIKSEFIVWFEEEFVEVCNTDGDYWKTLETPFHCLLHHVKIIDITMEERELEIHNADKEDLDYYKAYDKETNLVQFLLKNALVLEEMAICIYKVARVSNARLLRQISRTIRRFPKAPSAKISISYR
ncbi:hypothetical protein GIB67_041150 [Kingdonia uniflora]|uniref:F-box domain-containing protein n=1 Tax=Kingdonia uniflora TaxID=39325 RepID=A0A7J7LKK9_9MAGN|nr:hypothetical protein GIB67_041150 [Kingdonia uniflora]